MGEGERVPNEPIADGGDPGSGSTDTEVTVLLAEYERLGTTIKHSTDRQARMITNGIAAGGLVLAYAFARPLEGSILAVTAVPFIIGAVAVLSIGEDVQKIAKECHMREIAAALRCREGLDVEQVGQALEHRDEEGVTLSDPLPLFYVIAAVFFFGLIAGIIIWVPIQFGFARLGTWGARVLLFVAYALLVAVVARTVLRHDDVNPSWAPERWRDTSD